jgi:hypothetical protein
MKLSRTEINWIISLVKCEREVCKKMLEIDGNQYASFLMLRRDNMDSLADKLETILLRDLKRIGIDDF